MFDWNLVYENYRARYGDDKAARFMERIRRLDALPDVQWAIIRIATMPPTLVPSAHDFTAGFNRLQATLTELSKRLKEMQDLIRSDQIQSTIKGAHQTRVSRRFQKCQNFKPGLHPRAPYHKKGYYQQVKRQRRVKRQKQRMGRSRS